MSLIRETTPRPILTTRQREVMAAIARGLANKEIAAGLGITEEGVKAHVSRLLALFGVRNRAALAALGRDLGGADGESPVRKITTVPPRARRPAPGPYPQWGTPIGPAVLLGVARLRATLEAVEIAFDIARGLPAGTTSAPLIRTLQTRIRSSLRETDRLERHLLSLRSSSLRRSAPKRRPVTRSRATSRS